MGRVSFKSCPRCKIGDLVLGGDKYGSQIKCIQCGYANDLDDGLPARRGFELVMSGAAISESVVRIPLAHARMASSVLG